MPLLPRMPRLSLGGVSWKMPCPAAPGGFTGTDGVFVLQPNGQVRRGLAVFQIAPGAPVITSAAPTQLNQPGN